MTHEEWDDPPHFERFARPGMLRAELLGLGYTDDELAAAHKALFGERPELANDMPDTGELCVLRRAAYDACAREWYRDEPT